MRTGQPDRRRRGSAERVSRRDTVKIGMTLGHDRETIRTAADNTREMRAGGLDITGFSDTQSIYRETYCTMTAAALAIRTDVVERGNPAAVLSASALATVDEASGGRVILTVGTGASSVANLGMKRATPRQLAEGVDGIRSAFKEALSLQEGSDRQVVLAWPKRAVAVFVSASTSGPACQSVAAHHADGVLFIGDVGDTAVLGTRIAHIKKLRASGPLADERFRIWVYAPGFIDDDLDHARDAVASVVCLVAAATLDPDIPDHLIPAEHGEAMRALREGCSFEVHASPRRRDNVELMERLGLADFIFGRMSLTGSADDVARCLEAIEQLGVEAVVFTGSVPDKHELVARLATLRQALDRPAASTA